jgi:hypothetical protein
MTLPLGRCDDAVLDVCEEDVAAVDIERAAAAAEDDAEVERGFGCDEAEREDVVGGCWRKAARKEERKKGRCEDGILVVSACIRCSVPLAVSPGLRLETCVGVVSIFEGSYVF